MAFMLRVILVFRAIAGRSQKRGGSTAVRLRAGAMCTDLYHLCLSAQSVSLVVKIPSMWRLLLPALSAVVVSRPFCVCYFPPFLRLLLLALSASAATRPFCNCCFPPFL
eukprot:871422-Pleurochrysis_carterae.AAC.2